MQYGVEGEVHPTQSSRYPTLWVPSNGVRQMNHQAIGQWAMNIRHGVRDLRDLHTIPFFRGGLYW
jgi:hypothetical protein